MDNALSFITEFNLTKTQIDLFAQKAIEQIDTGLYNPLSIHLCLKAMDDLIRKIKEGIAEQVMIEAEKYGKSFEYMGAKVQLTERRTYDYSNDDTWNQLNKSLKQREELLKYLTAPLADTETGEIINPVPYKITSVIMISLPK
jgi:phosphoenolpyruvate carboxylase